jgi:hypothetical protein
LMPNQSWTVSVYTAYKITHTRTRAHINNFPDCLVCSARSGHENWTRGTEREAGCESETESKRERDYLPETHAPLALLRDNVNFRLLHMWNDSFYSW